MASPPLGVDDITRQSSSRSSSRRSWRSTSVREMWNAPDVFQRSSRQQVVDEEEELKWAAIERLPTYDRMRKGMLRQAMSNGRYVTEEVDVAKLGVQDKKQLMESILKVVEDDNERFLKRLRARNDRVGIDIPKVEVRFEKLSIEGDAYVGTRALPTLLNSTLNQIEGLIGLIGLSKSNKRIVKILQDVSDICADIMVGDDMRRGISGGQKKRVTTGEMLAGPAKAFFMDEISTGLDSSTTFQITKFMRQMVHIMDVTMVISLLQPAPETYDLFDDIILISEGQIVYQGPRENVLEFFEYMGFRCPDRKGVADFLQEVTSKKDQEQYWYRKNQPYRYISVPDFVDAFNSFHIGQRLVEELRVPYDKRSAHPAALVKEKYGISNMELFKACLQREWLLMQRNSFVYIFKTTQITIMATIAFTVFLRTEMKHGKEEDSARFWGALFFSLINVMFNGVAELSMTVFRLPVFFKQRDALFYPGWAFGLPIWLTRIPISFMESFIWIALTYYTIGFAPAASRFFKQFLAFFGIHQMAVSMFRFIAALGRTEVVANTIGSFTLLLVFILGGYIVARDDIKPWMIWGFYSSPMMYGQNAIAINEYLDKRWSAPLPNGRMPTVGQTILRERGLFTEEYWYWICIGALLGFSVLFNVLFIGALTFLNPLGGTKTLINDDGSETDKKPRSTSNSEGIDMQVQNAQGSSSNGQVKRGMVLPFQPLSLAFNHVNYYVDMPVEMKTQGIEETRLQLLRDVSGAFRPGILTALVGVSGAGKTTLMDVLAGRKTGGYIEGSISISGYPKNQATFARMFVDEVMDLVELNPLRNALVGLPGVDGLSTEQRKRLTIAVELVANPSIIFMDEPTSGLDARAAAIVMRTVRNTVDTGRTVVCTIHQPSIDIFEAFDELFLMKRGGQVIYAGPLGPQSHKLVEYFEAIPGVPKIKEGYNPATWMLEVSSAAVEAQNNVDFAEIFANSELYRQNQELIKELSAPQPGSSDLYFPTQYSQSFTTQCHACFWKQHWSYWRNSRYNAIRLFMTAGIGILFGVIFWGKGDSIHKQQDLINLLGATYSAVLFLGASNANAVQSVVAIERTVFYRERAAGMYSELPYAFAQVAIETIYVAIQTFMYSCILYSMIGYVWTVEKFLYFYYFIFMCFTYMSMYGMMMVALTPGHQIAAIVSSFFTSFWNLFSGFLISRPLIPVWWRWYYWGSPIAWSIYGIFASQVGDNKDLIVTSQGEVRVDVFIKDNFGYDYDFLIPVVFAHIGWVLLFFFVFAYGINMSWRSISIKDMWNEQPDVFQRSRAGEEEEELRWAAIERLPTYDRLRKGMLRKVMSNGRVEHGEVEITKLKTEDKKQLMDSILKIVEEDNEKLLKRLRDRTDRVGIEVPKIEVRFEHLSVEGDAYVGTRALPTLINSTLNAIEGVLGLVGLSPSKKRVVKILQDVSGIVRPSRMCLLLGPPASGKTTFLKALTGQLDDDLRVTGKITYCGHELSEFVPQRTSAYISQHDLHYGEMTVRETLDFSGRCLGVGTRYEMLVEASRCEKAQDLRVPYDRSNVHPAALVRQKYGISNWELLKACFSREWLLMKRNSFVYIFKTVQLTIMATIAFTVFLRTQMKAGHLEDAPKFWGALFFSLINVMFNGMAELAMTVMRLPVFFKQRDALFYPGWAFGLPIWLLRIPISLMESAIWIILTYYTIGFAPAASRFFKQFLALFGVHQMALSLFRFLAAVGRTEIVASTIGTFTLLMVFVLGGFIVSKNDIKPWMIWGYYISPMMYGQNAIAINEFLDKRWSTPINGSSQPTVGKTLLKERGLFVDEYWYWICIGALLGYSLLFNIGFIAALTFLKPLVDSKAVIADENSERKTKKQLTGTDNSAGTSSSNNEARRGMILPFHPLSLAFNHVNYYVDMPAEMKSQGVEETRLQLLRDVSGAFRPGVLTALVGVSGAGKTTLMDVLSGRKTGGYIEGSISISGYPKNQATFARVSGYCEQNDIHSPYVTVYESLLYSSWLRLASDVKKETRKMFVEEVMELIELNPLRNALVGLPGVDGLSTEQRKRLTIAVELVANPSIIFMDEPTSGLDARAAAIVMRAVRNTVDTGRTVVCTIHQPSIDIFESFDELLLMKRGGRVIYAGPLGSNSHKLVEYFEAIEGVQKIKEGYNPATWMLEISSTAVEAQLNLDFSEYNAVTNVTHALLLLSQLIPIWWRWYYWCSPVAWTIYGVFTSQVGDKKTLLEIPGSAPKPVDAFLKEYLGYDYDFLVAVVFAHLGWVLLFFFIFAYGIRFLNFQKR
ncbi:unnamed protein product [Malus baccata var. baccata]